MSTKEERPTLAGVRLKTRKRNIVVPHDPQSFADAVILIIEDAAEGNEEEGTAQLEKTLDSVTKSLDSAELDFSRYGEVLFEVGFAGARFTTGGNVATDGKSLPFNILAAPATREAAMPYIKWFQSMIRRRPFLVKSLENTLTKLILSLEFYDEEGRKKIAIALSRCFALKVGILPESVLPKALVDRLVQKGTVLHFVTEFFKDFLATDTVETLMDVLRRARLDAKLLEFFPQQKRTWPDFEAHFNAAGLPALVDYARRKLYDQHCQDLANAVRDLAAADPPASSAAVVADVKAKKEEWGLADNDIAKSMFLGLIASVLDTASSKNLQQIQFGVLRTLKSYSKALAAFATTGRMEASLMAVMQVTCYEDSRLLKLFADIVKILYDQEVLGEDTIRYWYAKGSSPKGRNVFLKNMEPFMKWLEEADEEGEEEDEE